MQVCLSARLFVFVSLLLLFCACAPALLAQDAPGRAHQLTDREKQTVLDTEILDPYRFRGPSGSNKNHFTISETDATPSFLPGAIPQGKWTISFGVSNIRPDMTSSYEAHIYFDRPIDEVSLSIVPPQRQSGLVSRRPAHAHGA